MVARKVGREKWGKKSVEKSVVKVGQEKWGREKCGKKSGATTVGQEKWGEKSGA